MFSCHHMEMNKILKQKKIPVIIIILTIFLAFHWPVYFLEATDHRFDEVLFRKRVALNDEFKIKYSHSVMKTPVEETYQIMPNRRVLLKQMIYVSHGAGLPSQKEHDWEITPDGFRMYNINQSFGELIYRTAAKDSDVNFKLIFNGKEVPFLDFSEERTPVKIEIKRNPIWLYWIKNLSN